MRRCHNCNKQTKNPKFCSRKCSAIFTNKTTIKRKRTNKCKICQALILSSRKYCKEHKFGNILDLTLGTLRKRRKYQANSVVREHARNIYRNSNKPKYCTNCGYTQHYEVCHIQPISSFSLDSKIRVINDLDNLIALCPNCHWEFDNL